MKKVISFILILCIVSVLFCGCGKKNDKNGTGSENVNDSISQTSDDDSLKNMVEGIDEVDMNQIDEDELPVKAPSSSTTSSSKTSTVQSSSGSTASSSKTSGSSSSVTSSSSKPSSVDSGSSSSASSGSSSSSSNSSSSSDSSSSASTPSGGDESRDTMTDYNHWK